MGHRACFIFIKSDGKREFYYSRQASNSLDDALLRGLDGIARLIQDETPISEAEWLFKSGGQDGELLMDYQKKVVIWYGGSETRQDPIYRRVLLKVLRQFWKDWDIRWAYNEVQDIREYAGYPLVEPYLDFYKQLPRAQLDPDRDGQIKGYLSGVLSIIDSANQCRLIPLHEAVHIYLLSGPAFFARWEAVQQLESLVINTIPLSYWDEEEPNEPQGCGGGIHLNLSTRTLDYWQPSRDLGMAQLIFPMWKGWQITMHYDEFEWQERITNGVLRFKIKSEEEVLAEVLSGLGGVMPEEAIRNAAALSAAEAARLAKQPKPQTLLLKIFVYLLLIFIATYLVWALIQLIWNY